MKTPWQAAAQALARGELAVIPTDTIYGLVAPALDPAAIVKLDAAKERASDNPYIILISSLADLGRFDISLDERSAALVDELWPGPVSIVLPCSSPPLEYLHRGHNLAFRWPETAALRELITTVGPLAAPSANKHGQPPASTLAEARAYFGSAVAAYVPATAEPVEGQPSALVDITGPTPVILRPGSEYVMQAIELFRAALPAGDQSQFTD